MVDRPTLTHEASAVVDAATPSPRRRGLATRSAIVSDLIIRGSRALRVIEVIGEIVDAAEREAPGSGRVTMTRALGVWNLHVWRKLDGGCDTYATGDTLEAAVLAALEGQR